MYARAWPFVLRADESYGYATIYYGTGPTVKVEITGINSGTNNSWRIRGRKTDTTVYLKGQGLGEWEFDGVDNKDYVFQIQDFNGTYQNTSNLSEAGENSIFTVSFDSSGDSGGDDGGGGWEEPTYYTVTLDNGGYTWDTFPSNTEHYGEWNDYLDLSAITKPSKKTTSTSAGSFEIIGKANGGQEDSEATATITKKTTYEFTGWKDPQGNIWNTIYQIPGDVTLSAQQQSSSTLVYSNNKIENLTKPSRSNENKTYKITYNYDEGEESKKTETSTAELSYRFNYWCSNASGTGTEYTDSSDFKKNDGDTVTVYAIWTTMVEEPAIINLPTTEKVGFKFRGWTTADQATLYEAGTSVEVTKDTEFIAVWESEGRVFIHDGTKWIPVI